MRILLLLTSFLFFFSKEAFATINFQISNFEKVSDYYSVDALITTSATGSSYFVQAMFTPTDSNNYFGYTWNQKGDWFKYISSPDKEFIKSDFPVLPGNTTQKILFKPDTESVKYHGPGEYLLKLKRYTGESSSGTYSDNSLTVTLSDISPSPENTVTSTPTSTPTLTATPTSTSTPSAANPPLAETTKKTVTPSQASQSNSSDGDPKGLLRGGTSIPTPIEKANSASLSSEILGASIAATPTEVDPIPSEPPTPDNRPSQTDSATAIAVGVTSLGLMGIIFYRLSKFRSQSRL